MATGTKVPTIESKALAIAIRRAMATREMKTPALASESNVPYGTLRKILELNTVADYEQLCRISAALKTKLSDIVADAEELSTDAELISDFEQDETDEKSGVEDVTRRLFDGEVDLSMLSEDEKKQIVLDKLKRGDMSLAANHDINKEAERDYYPDAGA